MAKIINSNMKIDYKLINENINNGHQVIIKFKSKSTFAKDFNNGNYFRIDISPVRTFVRDSLMTAIVLRGTEIIICNKKQKNFNTYKVVIKKPHTNKEAKEVSKETIKTLKYYVKLYEVKNFEIEFIDLKKS